MKKPLQPSEFVVRRYLFLAALGHLAQSIVTLLTFGQFTFHWGGYWNERNVAYVAAKRRAAVARSRR
jgi:hypothetical protein